jgi:DNA polymerase III epsilon subunit-like protein
MTPKEAKERNSERVVKSCWEFLSKCNVVIGHNFQSFDAKRLNTAFLHYGLAPLKYIVIDTLLIARQNFHFDSNKMKFINDSLGIKGKLDNDGFPLWKACDNGDAQALKNMLEYNEGDIESTEDLFYTFRPYIRNFNVALYNEIEEEQCPVCGGTDLKTEGYYYTSAGKWESVRCNNCKCISRRKTNLLSKEKRKGLLINS